MILWTLALMLLVMRWLPGDRIDLAAPICYAPSILLIIPLFILFAAHRGRARRIAFAFTLVVSLAAFLQEQPAILASSSKPPTSHGKPLRVLLLNVQSYLRGPKVVADAIRAEDPDVIALLESTSWGRVLPGFREEIREEYLWTSMRYLALGTKKPVVSAKAIPLPHEAFAARAVLEWQGRKVALWLIDMPTPPRRRGAAIYAELTPLLQSEDLPVLVVGDMNTPRQSPLLRRAFRGFEDTSRAPGSSRWLATWPSRFPMWQIDHAHSRGLIPVTSHFVHGVSDHLGIVVEVAFPPEAD